MGLSGSTGYTELTCIPRSGKYSRALRVRPFPYQTKIKTDVHPSRVDSQMDEKGCLEVEGLRMRQSINRDDLGFGYGISIASASQTIPFSKSNVISSTSPYSLVQTGITSTVWFKLDI